MNNSTNTVKPSSKMFLRRFFVGVIRLRWLVYLIAVVWLVFGVSAMMRLPIDALPNLSENQVLIYVRYTDKSPTDIYASVTKPLSESLGRIDGLKTIRGSSDNGFALLYLIFEDSVPLNAARKRVEGVLSQTQLSLPAEVEIEISPAGLSTGQIVWYTVQGSESDLAQLRYWQDHVIAPRLEQVPGVAEVATVGGFNAEIESSVSAKALLESNISLSAFEKQLSELISANSNVQSLLKGESYESTELFSAIQEIEGQSVLSSDGARIPLSKLGNLTVKPAPRHGSFEQDGSEAVAGIVHMTAGENTVEVTRRVLQELAEVQKKLPKGWTCLPTYDRLQLIGTAVGTVTRTLLEALIVTTVCIVLVMRHWRTSLTITLTLPLSVLGAVCGVYWLGGHDGNLNANIMSLAGVAVSIGILVDATVVVVENVTHRLKLQFRSKSVTGMNIDIVAEATAQVALPAIMSVVLMIISFLPLFALRGLDGQMIRPLVWSKTLTLLSVVILTLTLVPCLATDLIRGNLRSERQSKLLRGIISIYSPLVSKVCDHPQVLLWGISCLAIVASAATAIDWLIKSSIVLAVGLALFLPVRLWLATAVALGSVLLGVICKSSVSPIQTSLRIPLDEGMVMDMPISRPGISLRQATDDLKARNMILCRFPEVKMAAGKAGRGETAFDPAPIEMIETMVEFRPSENWPSRRLRGTDAGRITQSLLVKLQDEKLVEPTANLTDTVRQIVDSGMPRFEAIQREVCSQFIQAFEMRLGQEFASKIADASAEQVTSVGQPVKYDKLRKSHPLPKHLQIHLARSPSFNSVASAACILQQSSDEIKQLTTHEISKLASQLQSEQRHRWLLWRDQLNAQLQSRAAATWTQIAADEIFQRTPILDDELKEKYSQIQQARFVGKQTQVSHHTDGHSSMPGASKLPLITPHRQYDQLLRQLISQFQGTVRLEPHTRESLTTVGGELDRSVQMPGWVNVWTRPIQNRIDMLTTGVNSEVGIRVMGDNLNTVVSTSEEIAQIVTDIPGAFGVLADPIRGKDQVDFHLYASKTTHNAELVNAVQAATDGIRIPSAIPIVIRLQQTPNTNADPVLSIELPFWSDEKPADDRSLFTKPLLLSQVGEIQHHDSAATIKSTDGLISSYVRLNVVGRSASDWVESAQKQLSDFQLPSGVRVEWTGQFEHAHQTSQMLAWLVPFCILLIVLAIWLTFQDIMDSAILVLTLPGALVGAAIAQWLLGLPISLSVIVGYISCLGMAAATGMVMLTYLRSSIEQSGGLESIRSEIELKVAVVRGASHRLRPKLLTEVTMIASLVPIMWSTGVGSDVIRPMAAPVLGGILIADEVIDLIVPALFYKVRQRRWRRIQALKTQEGD